MIMHFVLSDFLRPYDLLYLRFEQLQPVIQPLISPLLDVQVVSKIVFKILALFLGKKAIL